MAGQIKISIAKFAKKEVSTLSRWNRAAVWVLKVWKYATKDFVNRGLV